MRISKSSVSILLFSLFVPTAAFAEAPGLDKGDTAWMLVSSLLVLMMSLPGLALFYGGLVRKDNILATLMQTFAVACVVSLFWPIIGYSLVFTEGNAWIGNFSKAFLNGLTVESMTGTIPESVFIMFQMTFAIITTALLMGSVADRIKFSAILVFAVLWMTLVYSPIAHWVWGPAGMIGGAGVDDFAGIFGYGKALDFAGGTVVHISSGMAGLVAALVLGRKLHEEESTSNNLILSIIGASLLWVGWFGFNAGSALAAGSSAGMAMLVTNTSSAAGALTWILVEWALRGKPSVGGAILGAVAGLVTITPAAGFVDFKSSLVIGIAGGAGCFFAVAFLKEKMRFDDSLDVFGVHGIGGIIGSILTGVFASEAIGGTKGVLEGNTDLMWAQIISVVVTMAYSGAVTFVLLKFLDWAIGLRVDEGAERGGLDLALHGEKVHVYD